MVPVVVEVIGYRDGSAGDITCPREAIETQLVRHSRATGTEAGSGSWWVVVLGGDTIGAGAWMQVPRFSRVMSRYVIRGAGLRALDTRLNNEKLSTTSSYSTTCPRGPARPPRQTLEYCYARLRREGAWTGSVLIV